MDAPSLKPSRWLWVDALKGVLCLCIVLHHLAVYGPMPEAAHALVPGLMGFWFEHGRLAVHGFLVLGGYFTALSLAPRGVLVSGVALGPVIWRRYLRLAVPFVAAVLLAMACDALARPWLGGDVSDLPTWRQLLAHGLLMQDVLGVPSLLAGAWYVAIDFQLFVLTLLLLGCAQSMGTQSRVWSRGLVLGLTGLSLAIFNLDASLDWSALYFFGSYGLGVLACWARHSRDRGRWLQGLAALVALALCLAWRERLVVAAGVMALLVTLPVAHSVGRFPAALAALGERSYSVFLVHTPMAVLVSVVVMEWGGRDPVWNLIGLVCAAGLGLAAGWLFYRWVERPRLSLHLPLALAGAYASMGLVGALLLRLVPQP